MEEMHVAVTKNGKRKWTLEQKLGIVNELNSGVEASELCRKYNIHAQMLYKWRKTLESGGKEGLKNNGEIVPKGRYIEALKKIEELDEGALNLPLLIQFSGSYTSLTRWWWQSGSNG